MPLKPRIIITSIAVFFLASGIVAGAFALGGNGAAQEGEIVSSSEATNLDPLDELIANLTDKLPAQAVEAMQERIDAVEELLANRQTQSTNTQTQQQPAASNSAGTGGASQTNSQQASNAAQPAGTTAQTQNSATAASSAGTGSDGPSAANSGPVTQTSQNGNATASSSAEVKPSSENGFSLSFKQECSAGGNCATAQGVAVAAGGQGHAQALSLATAGDQGSASATTTSVSGSGEGCTSGVPKVTVDVSPDGSRSIAVEFSSGAACVKSEATAQ